MKNGKHKIIRLIRLIRGQKKQTYSLPFREGPGVGFSPREARLTHKIGVSGFRVFQVFRTNENPLTKCAVQQNVSFLLGFVSDFKKFC